ncbi:stabilizer of axonemal microtubules 2 [Plakobranchus ocellatus]|uniref:Stabilizer of axonemal microtubules 2 n=1 Tax=Plakobranchus ocellatus TaxID=259542 RepID=A0AAV3Z0A6_9GAST|nr:stabilizer of axonemal microtubules 2 [Plakobranchus ocellatus]
MAQLQREDTADSLLNNGPRSEYAKRFQVYPIQRVKPFKPQNVAVRGDAPVDSETVFRRDYPHHPIEPRIAAKPAEGNLRPEGQHYFTSSYQNEFHPRTSERRQPYKPEQNRSELPAFDAQPSYREDYPVWQLPEKQQKSRQEWFPPDKPFNGLSTNETDFPAHEISPRVDFKPDNRPVQSDVPFDASTDYNDTFKVHELPPRVPRVKLEWTRPNQPLEDVTDYRSKFTRHEITPRQQKEKEAYVGPTVPMDTNTTVGDSYQGAVQPMRESFKPDQTPLMSDVPFDDSTTMHRDFRPHEVKPREQQAKAVYQPPPGEMDLVTSHTSHYTGHEAHKRDPVNRPGSSGLLKGAGDMNTLTTHQNDFIQRPLQKRENMRPTESYLRPVDPMDSETTQRADFYQRQIAPTKSFRPSNVPVISDVPLDTRTGYQDTFVPHKITPRQIRPRETHKPPSAQFEDRTTVRDSYQGHTQAKRDSFRPDRQAVQSDAPFEANTTMNNDFRPYDVQLPKQHVRDVYQRPEGEMDLTTTHTSNYRPHNQARRGATDRPGSSGLLRGHGPMRTDTNYQGDFRQPPPVPRQLVRPKRDYEPPSDPMACTTTQRTSFLEHGLVPRFTYKPQYQYQKPEVPLEDSTGYKESFQQHPTIPRQPRPKEVHEPPKAPFEDRTITNQSYIGPVQPKRDSFRPDRDYYRSELPLEGETTANASFKAWPTQQRERPKQKEYVKPDGFMDLTTCNRESYKEVKGQRPTAVRLGSSHLLQGGGAFDTTTSYGSEFVPKSLAERKLVRPENQYVPSSLPFSSQTEYRATHVGHVAPRERTIKPDNRSDTLNQRDVNNPFRIRDHDWRQMLNMADTVSA